MIEDYTKYPKYYYRYLPFNKQTINSLKNKEFWFSNPNNFNDPFDCKIDLDFDINIDELKKHYELTNTYYTEIVKSILSKNDITLTQDLTELAKFLKFILNTSTLSDDFVYQKIDDILNRGKLIYPEWIIEKRIEEFKSDPVEFMKHIQKVSREEIKFYRILCLSKTKKNSTMWAHYSDSHKGVCIKFESASDYEFFNFPLKVEYKARYPKYNYIREWGQHGAARHVLRTKNINWKYENEYRIVKDIRKTDFRKEGFLKINKSAINEVNFGLKADQKDIELFQEINKKYYDNKILVFKAKEKPKSFDLTFDKI